MKIVNVANGGQGWLWLRVVKMLCKWINAAFIKDSSLIIQGFMEVLKLL